MWPHVPVCIEERLGLDRLLAHIWTRLRVRRLCMQSHRSAALGAPYSQVIGSPLAVGPIAEAQGHDLRCRRAVTWKRVIVNHRFRLGKR